MRQVKRSALVPYSAAEMFKLVNDVDAYADFLPWCSRSRILDRSDDTIEATLELHKGAVSKQFTTRNTLTPDEAIEIALLGGPFRHLAGGWRFQPLSDEGCKVGLELEFQFENRMIDMMFGAFFEDTCNSMVDAFTARAEEIYGVR